MTCPNDSNKGASSVATFSELSLMITLRRSFASLSRYTLIESHVFYFSFAPGFSISFPIAAVRTYQALYQKKWGGASLMAAEIVVELLRIVQLGLFLAHGTHTTFGSLFSAETWKEVLAGVRQLEMVPFWRDLLGYTVVFGLYNAILFAILRPSNVQKMMDKAGIRRFEVSAVRNAAMLACKNLFLIPVSVIYLFMILNIM